MKNPYCPKCADNITNIEFNSHLVKDNVKSPIHTPTFSFIQCGKCGHVFGVIDTQTNEKVAFIRTRTK